MARKKEFGPTITLRVPEYLHNAILQYADKHDCSKSDAIRELISGGINFYMVMEDEE